MTPVAMPWSLRVLRRLPLPRKLGLLEALYGRRLSALGIAWTRLANGLTWKLDLRNVTHRWVVYGAYENPAFIRWQRARLPRNGIVIDSGANIGQMTCFVAALLPGGRVYAFEPAPAAQRWLAECLAANPGLPVEIVPCGLGRSKRGAFLRELGYPTSHGAQNEISTEQGDLPVQLDSVDAFLEARGERSVDLWILDVEGQELEALAGAERALAEHRIRALYVECAFEQGRPIHELLEGHGYLAYAFRGRRLQREPWSGGHVDRLFLPGAPA